jgi:hypothetical protein
MRITRLSAVTALAFTLGTLVQAGADQVPGKKGDCAATWDTGPAAATVGNAKSFLTCQDGDPSCDTDGLTNGICNIVLNACVGQATEACPSPPALASELKFTGKINKGIVSGFVPPGAPPSCGTAGTLVLPLKRVPKKQTKPLKKYKPSKKVSLVMKAKKFKNQLLVQCIPPTGGTTCPLRTDDPNLPTQLTLTVPETGSDLDNGWTGSSHNFPVVNGSQLKYCLSNCDGTSDTLCDGMGTTGESSLNGPQFGAPLPLLAANVPVCVINRFQDSTITSIYDLATGQGQGDVNLFSDVYLTNNPTEVCPRCNPSGAAAIGQPGKCSQTARTPNASCTIGGQVKVALGAGNQQYYLSGDCIPVQSQLTATLDIKLPLTTGDAPALTGALPCGDNAGPQLQSDDCGTGTCSEGSCTGTACISGSGVNCIDAKGGISQACCSNNTTTPCFLSKVTGSITRTGTPVPPGGTGAYAATFCIARTNSTLINTVTGLPGPGALILPSEAVVTP